MTALALLLTLAAEPEVSVDQPPPRKVTVVVSLGSSHWVGQTFGTPIGLTTPSLAVAIHPGLDWLELGLRYSLAVVPLPLPNGLVSRVGFVSLELLLTRELRVGTQRFALGVGPAGAIVHTAMGAGFGAGPVLFARYLIDLNPSVALGPYFAMRPMFYSVPQDAKLLGREDLQGDLGIVASF